MSPFPSAPSGKTVFHVPVGGGLEEPLAIANEKIDRSIVAEGAEPLLGHPEYLAAAERLLTGDHWKSRRIFVTSPREGDGKTRTAFNLAAALAKPESPVLLAEMNFTRPRFRAVLGELRFRYGIETAVSGETAPAESVIGVDATGLYLAAVRRPTPEDVLDRRLVRLHDFFRWADDNYRLLVLDCPPVISPEWSHWFHAYVGDALLVVREDHTPVADVRTAAKLLDDHLKGAWFNREQSPAKLERRGSLSAISARRDEPLRDGPDRQFVRGFGGSYQPWSRETMRAVSVLGALASKEAGADREPAQQANETEVPPRYIRQGHG